MKLYIAVLDEFPDYMTPTLVAHAVLGYHFRVYDSFSNDTLSDYKEYIEKSFKKVVVRVNQKEFDKISALKDCNVSCENNTLNGKPSCVVWLYNEKNDMPNVLKYAKLWEPKQNG